MTNSVDSFPRTAQVASAVIVLESATSTNTVAAESSPPLAPFSVVITTDQRNGRGRLGRQWCGQPGEMLAASVVLPVSEPTALSLTPLLVGACLRESLREHGVRHAELKWPNDVLVEGRKIAGILCEVRGDYTVIAGVGLNLHFSAAPPAPLAIALSECGVDPALVTDSILATFVSSLSVWLSKPQLDQVGFVRSSISTLGLFVEVSLSGENGWRGIALDITPEGHLLVDPGTAEGPKTVVAADIDHLYQ